MKKLIFLLLMNCLFISSSIAQNDVDSKSYVYCELRGMPKLLTNKVIVSVDMGQSVKLFSNKNRKLVDENNNPIEFNSMVDAMNYMGQMGWEFIQAYVVTKGDSNIYHWMLKKDISKFSKEQQAVILSDIKLNH